MNIGSSGGSLNIPIIEKTRVLITVVIIKEAIRICITIKL